MRQWCADRYEHDPVTPKDMNYYHENYIDGDKSRALTMCDGDEILGYITLRTPADDHSEQRVGFVIVDDSKRGRGLGKALVTWLLIMHSQNSMPQKYRSAYLKTTHRPYIAMRQQVFAVFQGLR